MTHVVLPVLCFSLLQISILFLYYFDHSRRNMYIQYNNYFKILTNSSRLRLFLCCICLFFLLFSFTWFTYIYKYKHIYRTIREISIVKSKCVDELVK